MPRRRSWIVSQSSSCGARRPALSRSSGSLAMRAIASRRKPSTPRSSQKRSTSCIAASTSGLSQSRSGCSGMNECRYYWPVRASSVQAGPTASNSDRQSFGGPPSGAPSRHTYQSRFGLSRLERESANHGCAVGGVVRHPVEDHADAARVAGGDQRVEVRERAEQRVDVAVVGDVVAEVGHGGGEDRRQPDGRRPEARQVVQARGDAGQVADAVAVGVGERARVDLVDRAALPPRGRPRTLSWRQARAARRVEELDLARSSSTSLDLRAGPRGAGGVKAGDDLGGRRRRRGSAGPRGRRPWRARRARPICAAVSTSK